MLKNVLERKDDPPIFDSGSDWHHIRPLVGIQYALSHDWLILNDRMRMEWKALEKYNPSSDKRKRHEGYEDCPSVR